MFVAAPPPALDDEDAVMGDDKVVSALGRAPPAKTPPSSSYRSS